MRRIHTPVIIALVLSLAAFGCGKDDPEGGAGPAAGEAGEDPDRQAEQAGEAGEAGEEGAQGGEAPGMPGGMAGLPPEAARGMEEMGKAMKGLEKMAGGTMGPVVNWRDLAEFAPDRVGEFETSRKLEGSTTRVGGMRTSVVERRYTSGDKRLKLSITDTSMAPAIRTPFAMAQMIEEDSSDGYKKGATVDGHKAIVEWDESRKESKILALVGDRYLVQLEVEPADSHDEARKVLGAVDLDRLSSLKPSEE